MSKSISDAAISAYNAVCKVPQILGGRFTMAPSFAAIDFKQRCIPVGETESYEIAVNLDANLPDGACHILGMPVPLGKSSIFVSPSGKKQFSLKTSTTDAKQQFLQYWNANRLEHTFDLKALDLHQLVVEKMPFHAACWSPDERYFFYLAEVKQPKTKSYFDQKPVKPGDDTVPGNEYKYVEDWGEQLTGISKTVIGVVDSFSKSVRLLDYDGGEHLCVSKLLTNPSNADQLFAIVHHVQPFRVGLIYCTQRRSDLICITNWESGSSKLAAVSALNEELSILDATVSPDGRRIVWLQCAAGGPHNRAFELWTSATDHFQPHQITSARVCPLYFNSQSAFLRDCWLSDRCIIVEALVKSRSLIFTIDIDSKVVSEVEVAAAKNPLASFNLLDVSKNCILVHESSVAGAPAILVGQQSGPAAKFMFRRHAPFLVDDTFMESGITWSLQSTTFDNYQCQYIVAWPKNAAAPVPLIVVPHGGPHSAFTTAFAELSVALVLAGFGVIMINYPGSLGFDSLEALPGKIGVLDLQSVQHCVEECLSSGTFDRDNVYAFGGSHGGFLALRLIADYPDFYRAAACRNPVADFAQMAGVTDIPDWNFVECGLQPSLEGFINLSDIDKVEVLAKMNEQSPARFVNRVKCPLLMAVGRNDRRVPLSQGLSYCRMLKQVNPQLPIEILTYDDEHGLMKVPVHADVFGNVVSWFTRFRK